MLEVDRTLRAITRWVGGVLVVGMVISCDGGLLFAAEDTGADVESQPRDAAAGEPAVDAEQRESVLTVAMLLLAGILSIGAVLIGLVLLWGVRLRRLVRKRPPARTEVDELWYLKPAKSQTGADSEHIPGEPPNAGESETP